MKERSLLDLLTLRIRRVVILVHTQTERRQQDADDGGQVHEVVRQILHGRNAESGCGEHAGGAPRNDRAEGQRTIGDGAGEDALVDAELLIALTEGLDRHDSGHVGVAEDVAAEGGDDLRRGDQAERLAHQTVELGNDRAQQARSVEEAGHGEGDDHQLKRVAHGRDAAAVADLGNLSNGRIGVEAIHHVAEHGSDIHALIQPRDDGADHGGQRQGGGGGQLEDDHDDQGNQRNDGGPAHLEDVGQTAADVLNGRSVQRTAAVLQTNDGKDNQRNEECRAGGPDHSLRVLVDVNLRDARCIDAEVGDGGLLVAEVGAASHRTGRDRQGDAQTDGDAHEGNADRGAGRPGRTGHRGQDRAHHRHERQEDRRTQQLQADIDDDGYGTGGHPRADQHTDNADQQKDGDGLADGLDHRVLQILERDMEDDAVNGHDHRGDHDGDMRVKTENQNTDQNHRGDQQEHQQRRAELRLHLRLDDFCFFL